MDNNGELYNKLIDEWQEYIDNAEYYKALKKAEEMIKYFPEEDIGYVDKAMTLWFLYKEDENINFDEVSNIINKLPIKSSVYFCFSCILTPLSMFQVYGLKLQKYEMFLDNFPDLVIDTVVAGFFEEEETFQSCIKNLSENIKQYAIEQCYCFYAMRALLRVTHNIKDSKNWQKILKCSDLILKDINRAIKISPNNRFNKQLKHYSTAITNEIKTKQLNKSKKTNCKKDKTDNRGKYQESKNKGLFDSVLKKLILASVIIFIIYILFHFSLMKS